MNFLFPKMSKGAIYLLPFLYPHKKKFDELNCIGCESRKVFTQDEIGEYRLFLDYDYCRYGFLHEIKSYNKVLEEDVSIKYEENRIIRRQAEGSINYFFDDLGYLKKVIHKNEGRVSEQYDFDINDKGELLKVNNLSIVVEHNTTKILDNKMKKHLILRCNYNESTNSIIYEDSNKVETRLEVDNTGRVINKYLNSECIYKARFEDDELLVTYVRKDSLWIKFRTRKYQVRDQREIITVTYFDNTPRGNVWKEEYVLNGL